MANLNFPTTTQSYQTTQFNINSHPGIDIVPNNSQGNIPIYAVANGTIEKTFEWAEGDPITGNGSMGNAIFISHGTGLYPTNSSYYVRSIYEHLKDKPNVSGSVTKGDIIGYMGNTGNSSGTHLHFGLKYKSTQFSGGGYNDGTFFDPNTCTYE